MICPKIISSAVYKETKNMLRASYYWCNRKQIVKKSSFWIMLERKKASFSLSKLMKKN